MRILWNVIVVWLLWPVWWPLMVLLLLTTAGQLAAQDPDRRRTAILFNAWALALLCFGYRDID